MSVESGIIYTDKKAGESTVGYIGLYFSIFNQLVGMLSNPELGKMSSNVVHISNAMISLVPDKNKKIELRKLLQEKANEFKNETLKEKSIIDDADKSRIQISAGIFISGEVFEILNTYIGVTKSARLAFDTKIECDVCEYKVKCIENGLVGDYV
jgi:hypothetical protein